MENKIITYYSEKTANGFAYNSVHQLVTSTASATATSTVSQENADAVALNLAIQLAFEQAQHDANVMNQATVMVEDLGIVGGGNSKNIITESSSYTLEDNPQYNFANILNTGGDEGIFSNIEGIDFSGSVLGYYYPPGVYIDKLQPLEPPIELASITSTPIISRNYPTPLAYGINCYEVDTKNNILYVGGVFSNVNGKQQNSIAAYKLKSNEWLNVDVFTDGLYLENGIYDGVNYSGIGRCNALKIYTDTDTDTIYLYVGGIFNKASGLNQNMITCYNITDPDSITHVQISIDTNYTLYGNGTSYDPDNLSLLFFPISPIVYNMASVTISPTDKRMYIVGSFNIEDGSTNKYYNISYVNISTQKIIASKSNQQIDTDYLNYFNNIIILPTTTSTNTTYYAIISGYFGTVGGFQDASINQNSVAQLNINSDQFNNVLEFSSGLISYFNINKTMYGTATNSIYYKNYIYFIGNFKYYGSFQTKNIAVLKINTNETNTTFSWNENTKLQNIFFIFSLQFVQYIKFSVSQQLIQSHQRDDFKEAINILLDNSVSLLSIDIDLQNNLLYIGGSFSFVNSNLYNSYILIYDIENDIILKNSFGQNLYLLYNQQDLVEFNCFKYYNSFLYIGGVFMLDINNINISNIFSMNLNNTTLVKYNNTNNELKNLALVNLENNSTSFYYNKKQWNNIN